MPINISGKDFLFTKCHGFINDGDDNGDGYVYSDGSGYYDGRDGSEGYMYSDGSGYYNGADGSEGYIYSDGSGYYHGADGSDGYIYSDGSGYYHGADGSDGYIYSDGSGYFNSSDGNCESYNLDEDVYKSSDETANSPDIDTQLRDSLSDILYSVGSVLMDLYFQKKREKKRNSRQQTTEKIEDKIRKYEEKAEFYKAKSRALNRIRRIMILITVLFVFLFVALGVSRYELQKMIPIGYSSDELIGLEYSQVIQKLESAGFDYIHTEVISDLEIDAIGQENCVTKIRIAWIDSFNNTSKYPSNFPVVITYHTLIEISVPMSSKEAKNSDYIVLEKAFIDAGFTNVETQAKYDLITGWVSQDGEVITVTINGDKKFDINDKFRQDAEVMITYHAWKTDNPD